MNLSGIERRGAKSQIFEVNLLNNARSVWPRTTKFGRVTCEEGARSHAPTAKGRGPALPFLGFPSINAFTLWCRTIDFDVLIDLYGIAWFYGPATSPSQRGGVSVLPSFVGLLNIRHRMSRSMVTQWGGVCFYVSRVIHPNGWAYSGPNFGVSPLLAYTGDDL